MNIATELSQRRLCDRNKHSIDMILGRLMSNNKKLSPDTGDKITDELHNNIYSETENSGNEEKDAMTTLEGE